VSTFRFPSGCVCYSKKNNLFEFAFGRSDISESLFVEEKDPDFDLKTTEAHVSDFKKKNRIKKGKGN
jgi:hypothetical protein